METVVQLRSDVARLMHGETSLDGLPDQLLRMKQSLDDALAKLGVSLVPVHPGIEDAELARYFTLSGTTNSVDQQVPIALSELEAVTAAYTKPEAEPA